MSRSRRARTASALLVAAACVLPACQSDGSIGRDDSQRGFVWREMKRREQFHRDVRRTRETLSSIPTAISSSFAAFPKRMSLLQHLYADGVNERWTYRERMAAAERRRQAAAAAAGR